MLLKSIIISIFLFLFCFFLSFQTKSVLSIFLNCLKSVIVLNYKRSLLLQYKKSYLILTLISQSFLSFTFIVKLTYIAVLVNLNRYYVIKRKLTLYISDCMLTALLQVNLAVNKVKNIFNIADRVILSKKGN